MTTDTTPTSRAHRLRTLLESPKRAILMEAHNGLSAKLAEEAGFEALWASGLSISAALGVRDNNEASWTQVLEVLEFMADACDLPILLDGDTGYGNFNNVRRLIQKLEQRNIAGVCLEDKLFPKTNSFIGGERQTLAEIDEFCGKIQAAKDTQRDKDFVVVARTEAFIAGWGTDEALLRASAYADSGADVILVHSKRKDAADIEAFMSQWDDRRPVLVVPTTYPEVKLPHLQDLGVSNFIFANHGLRTVITALQRNLHTLRQSADLMSVERDIAPVAEVFRLQNVAELQRSEKIYLPQRSQDAPRAVVLAASQGNFGAMVEERPKAMLQLHGKPILRWHVDAFRRQGLTDIAVVVGHAKQAVDLPGVSYFENDAYAETGELWSLYAAREFLQGELLLAYGDVVFDDFILRTLLADPTPSIRLAVDAAFRLRTRGDATRDLVRSSAPPGPLGVEPCHVLEVGTRVDPSTASGEWIGLIRVGPEWTPRLVEALDELKSSDADMLRRGNLPDLLNLLVGQGHEIDVVHTYGHWYDLDDQRALLDAENQVPG